MGVLFDYFSAPSDEAAAATIDRVGGPGSQASAAPAPPVQEKRGLFGRKRAEPAHVAPSFIDDESLPVFDTVSVKGIDPLVQLGTLEELLTGRPYDDVVEDPRSGKDLASRNGGERMVLTVTDALAAALIAASDEQLGDVALPWSQTEEFWGQGDAAALAQFLRDLAGLARRAETSGYRLYCWLSV
ncbi:MAG: hypothetical protein QM638_19200 [Nocardioides sp.]|uniref:hypothetical protein n=1 Tax=Nocardioides sp. TaxID=35761 RepID=UPI0039E4DCD2